MKLFVMALVLVGTGELAKGCEGSNNQYVDFMKSAGIERAQAIVSAGLVEKRVFGLKGRFLNCLLIDLVRDEGAGMSLQNCSVGQLEAIRAAEFTAISACGTSPFTAGTPLVNIGNCAYTPPIGCKPFTGL